VLRFFTVTPVHSQGCTSLVSGDIIIRSFLMQTPTENQSPWFSRSGQCHSASGLGGTRNL
jgi:hypothetical protein